MCSLIQRHARRSGWIYCINHRSIRHKDANHREQVRDNLARSLESIGGGPDSSGGLEHPQTLPHTPLLQFNHPCNVRLGSQAAFWRLRFVPDGRFCLQLEILVSIPHSPFILLLVEFEHMFSGGLKLFCKCHSSSFSLSGLIKCRKFGFEPGWQKLCKGTKGLRQQVWIQTKRLSPNIRYFVVILRFVTIDMVYVAYYTELN